MAFVDCQIPVGSSSPKAASVPAGIGTPGTGADGSMLSDRASGRFGDRPIARVQEGIGERGALVPHFGIVLTHDQIGPRAVGPEERECVGDRPIAIGEQLGDLRVLAVEFALRRAQWSPQAGGRSVIGSELSCAPPRRSSGARRSWGMAISVPALALAKASTWRSKDATGRCRSSEVIDQLKKTSALGVKEGQHAEHGQTERRREGPAPPGRRLPTPGRHRAGPLSGRRGTRGCSRSQLKR